MRRYAAPPVSTPEVDLGFIPKGYQGTQKTTTHIQDLIRAGAKDFYVRQKAIDILFAKAVKPKDYLGEVKALFEWVQQNIRYTKDPFRVEVLHSARRMLELRAGDCDDMTIVLGSMLEAIGHPVRLVITGPDPLRPQLFSHIYLETYHNGRWIPLDATMPHPMGWEPQTVVKQVIPIGRALTRLHQPPSLQGFAALMPRPDWLPGLIQTVRQGSLQPNDLRVKSLWNLLRQRQLLRSSPRLTKLLKFMWQRGLSARPRPKQAQYIEQLMQRWGLLPPSTVATTPTVSVGVSHQKVVRSLRPVTVRPVSGVTVKPIARVTRR